MPLNIVILLAMMASSVRSANILAVLPLDVSSHHRFGGPILKELAQRGHSVTVLTPIKIADSTPPSYREVIVPRMKMWDAVSSGAENGTHLSPRANSFFSSQKELRNRTFMMTDAIMRSQSFKDFLAEDGSYDLIVCELFHIEPFLMLSRVYNAPFVALSAFGNGHFINQQTGNPYELSYVSHEHLDLPSRYRFFDRLRNTFWTMVDLFERNMWSSDQDEMARRHLNINEDSPSLKEIERNVSLVLVNTHFSIDTVRPNVPGVVEVGGLHVVKPNTLPANVQKFADTAKEGVVYINLQSDVLKSETSTLKGQMLGKVFSSMPRKKFIWQRENDDVAFKYENVLVADSLQQSDVLAHDNVKAFVTHGGQLNIQEAVARGVPVVCIPMYGDQFSSCSKAAEAGYALVLDTESLCETSLGEAISTLLETPSYGERARRISRVFNDRPQPPLEAAVYWIEYALRHDGAHHVKSPALKLTWYEYYVADSLSVIGLSIYYFLWTLNWLFWNVALRKKVPRDDIQHLIAKHKKWA